MDLPTQLTQSLFSTPRNPHVQMQDLSDLAEELDLHDEFLLPPGVPHLEGDPGGWSLQDWWCREVIGR